MKVWLLITALCASLGGPRGAETQLLQVMQEDLPEGMIATDLRIIGRDDWSPAARVEVQWERGRGPGRRRVQVVVDDRGEFFRTWASVRISALRPSIVTRRAMAKGDRITGEDLEVALRPGRRGLDLQPGALVGQRIRRDVERGAPLGPKDVTLPRPLPRGTPVRVVSAVGGARIEISGQLVTSTRLGGRGRARVAGSRSALHGRLVEEDRFVLEVSR